VLSFIFGDFDNIPVGIVIIPTISVFYTCPSRNSAGVAVIHERY